MKKLFLTGLCAMTLLSSAPKAQAVSKKVELVLIGLGIAFVFVGLVVNVLPNHTYEEIDKYFEGGSDTFWFSGNESQVILFQVVKSSFDNEKKAANKVLDYYNNLNFNALVSIDQLGYVLSDLIGYEVVLRAKLGFFSNNSTKKKLVIYLSKVIEAREFVSKVIGAIKDKRVYEEQFDRNELLRRQEIEDAIRLVEARNDRKMIVQKSPAFSAGVIL